MTHRLLFFFSCALWIILEDIRLLELLMSTGEAGTSGNLLQPRHKWRTTVQTQSVEFRVEDQKSILQMGAFNEKELRIALVSEKNK